jgi:dihydrodipicolinate synthase/N-acetylneuraminate lyase
MDTRPITPERLATSPIAVPPLARNADLTLNPAENVRQIRHLEEGGVDILLYGGNANFHHLSIHEFPTILEFLSSNAGDNTLIVPAAGPTFGMMMDQALIARDFDFPTVMVLPLVGQTTSPGVAAGLRFFAESLGKPVVAYIKHEGYLDVDDLKHLVDDGLISWIKYAIVREDPNEDAYLSELVDKVDPRLIVSGIGEQPAVVHLRDFGINSFTAGCICLRPDLSLALLKAIQSGEFDRAAEIQKIFAPLEDLRNEINPVRVLHSAVAAARIAKTGALTPLITELHPDEAERVAEVARALMTA